jgi:uncharacterized RDD family membrane protein YckC
MSTSAGEFRRPARTEEAIMAMQAGEPGYAGFWRRFWALIIDTIIVNVALGIVAIPIFFASGFSLDVDPAEWEGKPGVALAYFGGYLVWLLYYALLESSPRQATLGKMVLSIKVTDMDGQRNSFWRAIARNLAKLISGAILMIGYLLAAFTRRKQALHDMIADCLVVRA